MRKSCAEMAGPHSLEVNSPHCECSAFRTKVPPRDLGAADLGFSDQNLTFASDQARCAKLKILTPRCQRSRNNHLPRTEVWSE
jgi:hypothetical protein